MNPLIFEPGHRKARVFVVDDIETNIALMVAFLSDHFDVSVALDGPSALEDIPEANPDIILLDIMMPGMDGHEVCRRLKANPATRDIPIIFVTARSEDEDETLGLGLGAVDYITKPISPPVVLARVTTHLQLKFAGEALANQNLILEEKVKERTAELFARSQELEQTRLEVIRRLGRAAEFKDNETGLHVIRMSHYSRILALAAGHNESSANLIMTAAPMHDIGKIGIPDHILQKPGPLDTVEWEQMRRHPLIGARIIGEDPSSLLSIARTVALTHHEKWDGSGYPRGMAREEIPAQGRIVAIADVFDALTTARPYKVAWPVEKALATLAEGSGKHFDPMLVDCFLKQMPEILTVLHRWKEPSA